MWYKGTIEECESYNNLVTISEKYDGVTTKWSDIYQINDEFYVSVNQKYLDNNLILVNELPEE
jgi:hypothetical protein